jgi:UDP-glucose:(heptosyl)LPS alpha-1,3-glucosyltransferase
VKIALVILHADPARGGAERYTVDLAGGLARRGHDVRIIATSFSNVVDPSMRVHLDARAPTRRGRYGKFLRLLDRHLTNERFDIVHAMLPVHRCDIYHPHAGMAAEQMEKSNAWFNPRRRAMAAVERALLDVPNSPIVLALSEYVKRSIRRYYALPDGRLTTLFNAVDLDRFSPGPAHVGRPRVLGLIIANDFARKGVGEAIRAVEIVNDPSLNLQIAGRGEAGPDDVATHWPVSFCGPVDDPRPLYREADFFVLPTKHDPCSLVVLEALAMGLPVISTKLNGATEIMTDGVHGYVLDDPRDVNALADAMRKLLDPAGRAAMREACLALRPQLSYEHHLDRLLGIYETARPAGGRCGNG